MNLFKTVYRIISPKQVEIEVPGAKRKIPTVQFGSPDAGHALQGLANRDLEEMLNENLIEKWRKGDSSHTCSSNSSKANRVVVPRVNSLATKGSGS